MKLIHCNATADCRFSASDTEYGVAVMATHFVIKHPEYSAATHEARPTTYPRPDNVT